VCQDRKPDASRVFGTGSARVPTAALPVTAVAAATRRAETSLRDRLRALDEEDDEA
jgi:hypothetical protein